MRVYSWVVRTWGRPWCAAGMHPAVPLSSELGKNKTVKAIFWYELEPFSVRKCSKSFKLFPCSSAAGRG